MESEQVSSAEEDLSAPAGLSVRLADFGTGKVPFPWLAIVVDFGSDVTLSSKLVRQASH
jgi:hypothetical protein